MKRGVLLILTLASCLLPAWLFGCSLLRGGEESELTFPCRIPGTTLEVRGLVRYEGDFREDGAMCQLTEASGLLLRNPGSTMVDRAELLLKTDGESFSFSARCVPPGGTLVALESRGRLIPYHAVLLSLRGSEARGEGRWLGPQQIAWTAVGDRQLRLTNLSLGDLSDLTLYYKGWDPEQKLAIGGRPWQMEIGAIRTGESRVVEVPHYARGYSCILGAKVP